MIRRLILATGYSGIGRLFSTLGNMLFVLAVSQHLKPSDLGVYALLFFFTQLFSGITPLGYPMYLAREVAHRRDNRQALGESLKEGGTALFWGSGLSLVVWLLMLLFYQKLPSNLLFLAVVAGILWGGEYLLAGILTGLERMAQNAFWHGVSLTLICAGLFLQSQFPLDLHNLFLLRIVATLIGLLGRLYALKDLKALFSLGRRLKSFHESSFFWYSGWVYLASRQLDVLILSFFLSDDLLGGYFLALRIFLTFGIVAEVLGIALIPFISRAHHGREERSLGWLFRRVVIGTFIVGIPLGVIFTLSRTWLITFFNPLLLESVSPLLGSLSWVIPFSLGNHLVGAFFSASNYQRERLYIHLAVIISTFIALVPLILVSSVTGAIWAKMGSDTVLFVCLCLKFNRILKSGPPSTGAHELAPDKKENKMGHIRCPEALQ